MNNVERIKDNVSMVDIARMYGLRPNRQGFISCPFHREKTASFKVYDGRKGYYCFGCGISGDVIDFVMRYYNLSFPKALKKIGIDFGIDIKFKKEVMFNADEMHDLLKAKEKILEKKINKESTPKKQIEELYDFYCDYLGFMIYIRNKYNPKKIGYIHPLYLEYSGWHLKYTEYMCEQLFEEMTREE